jgi:hypothetical protein
MDHCKHCGKELTHVEGRKKKAFCNVNCRNKYFYAGRKRMIEQAKAALAKQENPKQTVIVGSENEFMGHPIPEGLSSIQLAVWKNTIKVKAVGVKKM